VGFPVVRVRIPAGASLSHETDQILKNDVGIWYRGMINPVRALSEVVHLSFVLHYHVVLGSSMLT
jgi:hypothetical protein